MPKNLFVGETYSEEERIAILNDQCEKVEEMDFERPFSLEQLDEMKDQ